MNDKNCLGDAPWPVTFWYSFHNMESRIDLRCYSFSANILQIFQENWKQGKTWERPDWFWLDFARGIIADDWNCLNFGVFPHNRLAFRLKRPIEQAHVALNKHRIFPKAGMMCEATENYDDKQKLLYYTINLPSHILQHNRLTLQEKSWDFLTIICFLAKMLIWAKLTLHRGHIKRPFWTFWREEIWS